jgi:hypothetical protein
MLNLPEATELYFLLSPYLPDIDPENSLDYIQRIIKNIKDGDNPLDYAHAIRIMTGKTIQDLREYKAEEILTLFIEGLSENKIVALTNFMKSLGL